MQLTLWDRNLNVFVYILSPSQFQALCLGKSTNCKWKSLLKVQKVLGKELVFAVLSQNKALRKENEVWIQHMLQLPASSYE